MGYRCALATKERVDGAYEGLSLRASEALRAAGCELARESLAAPVERAISWNGEARAPNREFVIGRAAFDRMLRRDAAQAGVQVLLGCVEAVERQGVRWRVRGRTREAVPFEWLARFVVDARGRAAPPTRCHLRGPSSVALLRRFEAPDGVPAGTRVASWQAGWSWIAVPGDGGAIVQFLVDARRQKLPTRSALSPYFEYLIRNVLVDCPWLSRAAPAGPVTARAATAVSRLPGIADGRIRVGDAAMALDPLSGQGLYEALGAALAAAAVVNTMLSRPDDASDAQVFYQERLEELFLRRSRIGRDLHAAESRWPEHSFWADRRAWPQDEIPGSVGDGSRPSIVEKPVIENGFIARRKVLIADHQPRGVWQVEGVPIVELIEFVVSARHDLPTLLTSAVGRFARSPRQIAIALQWLHLQGLLRVGDEPSSQRNVDGPPRAGAVILARDIGNTALPQMAQELLQ